MKAVTFALLLLLGAFCVTNVEGAGDKTITKVVKLLQKMLDKSKKESEDDRVAYAKYKCYVDKNEAEKTESIKKLGEQIDLLESKIAELQARNGELSGQSAQLNADMAANKAAQKQATTIREDSEKAFKAMAEDLDKAIGQMKEAIDVLTAIALNQHDVKFMAGSSKDKKSALLNLGSEVRTALGAASALLPADKRQAMEAFLQAPLAAAQSKQGNAIVDILKDLSATFETNLKNARDSEAAEKKAFDESIDNLEDSWKKMDKSLKEKKSEMGDNDGELSSKKTSLEEATKQKAADEEFLEKLQEMAAKKAKDYEERKMLRANEEAAIAEAISILNSDDAFNTFGEVSATSTGATSFLQLRRGGAVRRQAELLLERAASQGHSARLSRVAAGLRAGNPFSTVLEEIDKMKKTIVEEGEADKENLDWCKKERENSNKDLDAKKSQIKTLNEAIDKLDETINDPKTGLKVMIGEKEADLVKNAKAQADQTKTRKEENAAYQEDVKNLSEAEDILGKAIKVLTRYYDALDKKMKESFVQVGEDPAPPKTYDSYSGQSKSGGDAISMLKFILDETEKEHKTADTDEKKAQDDFEDSIKKLKKDEADMQKALVKLKADLAEKEKELVEKTSDLKDTVEAKEAIEKYLLKIKPGCDFITENFDLREKNRETETKALDKAVTLIKDTPAYKAADAKEKELAAGKCKDECKLDTTNLDCKVCMSGSTKADYCKSKPGTPGCK